MTVIEAAAMRCKTMADGSLRIEVEVEPRNAQAAFALFGTPGRAVALAALVDGSGAIAEPSEPQSVAETPKKEREYLGDLCFRAVQWCSDPEFQVWLANSQRQRVHSAEEAATYVKHMCEIKSRKDLDTDPKAAERFNRLIRGPYQKHLQARGLV